MPLSQVYSRTKMRPSSKWISGAFHVGVWSNLERVRLIGIPGTIEPIEIGFFVGDPFLDRLPGRFDRFHGLDVKGRRWWARKLDDAFPQAMEAEEELDLLGAFDGTDKFHGSLAARALERVGTPDFEDEVAPEGAHGTGGLFWRSGDEEDLGLGI